MVLLAFPGPAYGGSVVAAVVLLAAGWYGIRHHRMPRELLLAAILAAILALAAGVLMDRYWSVEGVLAEGAGLAAAEADCAIQLLISPVYLEAITIDPAQSPFLRRGLAVEVRQSGTAITYHYHGFSRANRARLLATFLNEAREQLPGVLFAARLLTARTSADIATILTEHPPRLGRPSRLLVRQLVPELRDRFPAASGLLTDLVKRAGGKEAAFR